jgi:predicted permease
MFWRRRRSQDDFAAEIRSHLEMEAEDLRQEGIPAEDSLYTARRTFGNQTTAQERLYERGRWLWWDHVRQDLRYGARTLWRSPLFTLAVTATLALGIGANAAIFSVINAVLLNPLPYADPDRIVVLETVRTDTGRKGTNISAPDFHDWRKQNSVFEYMAYHFGGPVTSIANGNAHFVEAQSVTPDFFAVFGARAASGRFWSEHEDRSPLAVVSHAWAQTHLGDIGKAPGKLIRVDGRAIEVIGVMAPGFNYPASSEVWIPAGLHEENPHRSSHNYRAVGKLKPHVSLTAAQAEMRAIASRLEQEYYKENRFKSVAVTPLHEKLASKSATTLWVLFGAVFGVLLIACANVANLQLARAASRFREMAVRASLGAARGRILRQVLTESALLGALGAVAGLGIAWVFLRALVATAPSDIPRLDEVRMNGPVLLFAVALGGLCSILFGLAPARRSSSPDLSTALRQSNGRGSTGQVSGRTRSVLVVAEVALAVVLLAGAGFLLRSLVALMHVDLGFSTERLLLTRTSVPTADESEARRATLFQRDLLEKIRILPGVRRASGVRTPPLIAQRSNGTYWIDNRPEYRPGEAPTAAMQVATPGYFETLGISIRRGRDFSDADSWGRPQVAIINEKLAREAFGDSNPLGHKIRCGLTRQSMTDMEIVGVVTDARQIAPGEAPRPEIVMPYLQHPSAGSNLTLVVQTSLEPYALSSAIREAAKKMNPELPVRFSSMDELLLESLAYPRFRAALIGCFAAVAALLAVLGIYSVISYVVSQRTSEIGLRLALGAKPSDVFRLVVGGSMRMVVGGILLGLVGTLALSRVLKTLLFGITPHDPLTIGCVVGVLMLVAFLGSSIPALRAARLEPLRALRQE